MGLCISMPSSSSRVRPSSEMQDISTLPILIAHRFSMEMSREQRAHLMSNPTSPRTVITSTGEHFRSTDDLLEEVVRQLTML
ncbi:AC4 [Dolichos yellow mosaic virus]|uniref:AC4 n=2 Tax=Begomovirus TaxID=10814 RepID=A0A2I4HY36_9GEMI|nr:AC4 [Dolichos yellow mosaic virus]YP_009029993.1 AC4 [Dolichos yellow mosaic virus]AAP73447.1 AC4 [Dolichos yellow mosaic virus]AAQ16295.1 AC4 [Dolichos yellow mosaic virus]AHY39253.1 AC4 [Dolichos yellow mosaic virus]QZX49534.1 AC4 protein [Dolichos yellow mosaic virus]WLJ59212.1 AC4 [Dolichos yellow mosaic virus]